MLVGNGWRYGITGKPCLQAFTPLAPCALNVLCLVMATTRTSTRPNKRKLTSAEMLLDASSDSEVHDSDFDDSDNEQVAADRC